MLCTLSVLLIMVLLLVFVVVVSISVVFIYVACFVVAVVIFAGADGVAMGVHIFSIVPMVVVAVIDIFCSCVFLQEGTYEWWTILRLSFGCLQLNVQHKCRIS